MLIRIKQFFSAISAKLTKTDLDFINKYLNQEEKRLFFLLDLPTQKHSLNVTKTSFILAKEYTNLDLNLLLKASLLHDIGKPSGEIKTWHRVIIVLINRFYPSLAKILALKDSRSIIKTLFPGLGKAFYLQKNHPFLGGQIAKQNQLAPKIVKLIEEHHLPLTNNSCIELRLLQKADNLH